MMVAVGSNSTQKGKRSAWILLAVRDSATRRQLQSFFIVIGNCCCFDAASDSHLSCPPSLTSTATSLMLLVCTCLCSSVSSQLKYRAATLWVWFDASTFKYEWVPVTPLKHLLLLLFVSPTYPLPSSPSLLLSFLPFHHWQLKVSFRLTHWVPSLLVQLLIYFRPYLIPYISLRLLAFLHDNICDSYVHWRQWTNLSPSQPVCIY